MLLLPGISLTLSSNAAPVIPVIVTANDSLPSNIRSLMIGILIDPVVPEVIVSVALVLIV